MKDPAEIRRKIERARNDLARAEGEERALNEEIETTMVSLRDLLGCKAGQEKAAVKKLRAKIAEDEEKLEELLDAIEEEEGDDD